MKDTSPQGAATETGAAKPRLLVTTTTLPRFEGDPEPRFVLDLSKSLSRYFDVTILAPSAVGAAPHEVMEGVSVVRYRYAPLRSWETLAAPGAILPNLKSNPVRLLLVPLLVLGLMRAVLKQLKEQRFSCIHCHWILPQGLIQAMLFVAKHSPPFVVTAHGADAFALSSAPFLWMKRLALREAGSVTAVSPEIRDELSRMLGNRREPGKIVYIPMGVDLARFAPHPNSRERSLSTCRAVKILFVGRLAEKKGVGYLLDALACQPLSQTPASLTIVGDGPLKRDLQARCNALGLEHRVEFVRPKNHEELPEAYASADIFCAPSITAASGDREGLPVVLLEAAAFGLPLVATNVGGIGEVVRHQVTGILVPQQDAQALSEALNLLVCNEEVRLEYGEAARRHSQSFSWQVIGDRYAEVLKKCIEELHG
jgi:glycosyltransferase involved in cell wall biosynthesis